MTAAAGRRARDRRLGHFRYTALFVLSIVGTLTLLASAPFILFALAPGQSDRWLEVSYIGQTYGGIAGALGALALVGVAVSLVLQVRESVANREQFQREIQRDLLFRAIDDPELRACLGPLPNSWGNARQHIYLNVLMSFLFSMFVVQKLSELELRAELRNIFAAEPGRRYWEASGPFRMSVSTSRKEIRFHRIVDEEYRKATAATDREPASDAQP